MNARKLQESSLSHLDVNYVSLPHSNVFENDLQEEEELVQHQQHHLQQQQQGSSPTLTLVTSKMSAAPPCT
ncbi:uncharacterized protein Dmoj_GI26316 [Drosophila mojavensis]|uniref:Uncharacterized protein n=1 Tax=Drosophila mojavensis TaxID=7230 RepID=A0A0Q9XIS1_DROMO|nr:uncharacterized protein Dmoj_GI26316 [Drosophila mojavensis]